MINKLNRLKVQALLLFSLLLSVGVQADTAIFAGGCFWCVEAAYQDIEGVTDAVSGFTGGDPSGFEDRRWTAAVMRPEVHGGYAVQWLGLLLATVVIWIVLGLRRGQLVHRKHPTAGEDGRGARTP